MNAVIKYPGAKFRIASWIISQFPEHKTYLEPFFGSGAVFFQKDRSPIETINDLDGRVINLFRCIREDPKRLSEMVHWTPYSRSEYDAACIEGEGDDSFEAARKFLISCNMGFGRRMTGEKNGFKVDKIGREKSYAAQDWSTTEDRIFKAAERLRGVQIENRPAIDIIRQYNYEGVLIYADPPYVLDTRRHSRKQYLHEMSDEDHIELLTALNDHKGSVVVSGYDNDLYNDMLSGWRKLRTNSLTAANVMAEETIWMSFEPRYEQMRLAL